LSPFELERADLSERRVPAPNVVERFNVVKDICSSGVAGRVGRAMHSFLLERGKEASTAELSQQSPRRLVLQVMPSALGSRWKSSLVRADCPGPNGATARSAFRAAKAPSSGRPELSIRYTEQLAEAGVDHSVGSVGDSYDNALAESIIGLYKTEVIHHRGPWRHLDAVEYATLEWVDWFNNRRLLEPIGNVPPAELETSYHQSTSQPLMAA
jgi:transposase InsO family protein